MSSPSNLSNTTSILIYAAVVVLFLAIIVFLAAFFYRKSQRRRKKRRIDIEKPVTEERLRAAMRLPSVVVEKVSAPEISLKPEGGGRKKRSDSEGMLDSGFRWIDSGAVSDDGGAGRLSFFSKGKKTRKYSIA